MLLFPMTRTVTRNRDLYIETVLAKRILLQIVPAQISLLLTLGVGNCQTS